MRVATVAAAVVAIQSGVLAPGDRLAVHVVGPLPRAPLQVYLADPTGRTSPLVRIPRGRRSVTVRLPQIAAAVYRPAVRQRNRVVRGRGVLAVRAVPPRLFGAVGAEGCAPASPVVGEEAFGTASGAAFWGLFAFGPAGSSLGTGALAYDGVVGKEVKIVFRFTGGDTPVFYAVAPDGRHVAPVWREPHLGSTWQREGAEWGAGFLFDTPGCWQIHAGAAPAQGDLWLVVRT